MDEISLKNVNISISTNEFEILESKRAHLTSRHCDTSGILLKNCLHRYQCGHFNFVEKYLRVSTLYSFKFTELNSETDFQIQLFGCRRKKDRKPNDNMYMFRSSNISQTASLKTDIIDFDLL